jgi:hypothetical protein
MKFCFFLVAIYDKNNIFFFLYVHMHGENIFVKNIVLFEGGF